MEDKHNMAVESRLVKTAMQTRENLTSDWQSRHNGAINFPNPGFEQAIVEMFHGWALYAKTSSIRFESLVGNDGVLGDPWEAIGDSLRTLLNGDVGNRLDCGTLDGFILKTMRENGVDTDHK